MGKGLSSAARAGSPLLVDVPAGDDREHPYSLVRTPDGHIGWLSGVLPYDAAGAIVHERDAALDAVLRVLAERLAASGATLDDVVKVTVYLTDLSWRDAVNGVWYRAFGDPRPARTAVEVRALPRGAPVELDAVCFLRHGVT
jgi:enamine deaminase RidA (YjgF/YER057c/UK114 family)